MRVLTTPKSALKMSLLSAKALRYPHEQRRSTCRAVGLSELPPNPQRFAQEATVMGC